MTNERQPLLAKADDKQRLPYHQLLFVFLLRGSSPILFFSILPFINAFLVDDLNIASPATVGYKSGIIEAAMSLTVIIFILPSAWLSDIIGRRKVVLIALTGMAVVQCFFGLSKTFVSLVMARALLGFFTSATPAICKTYICESVPVWAQPNAWVWQSLGWQAASTLAPFLGGIASNPADTWPALFDSNFWRSYPYALPCFLSAAVPAFTAIYSYFVIKDDGSKKDEDVVVISKVDQDASTAAPHASACTKASLFPIFLILSSVFMICSFNAAQVLFLYTPSNLGGLGLEPRQISFVLVIRPIIMALFNTSIYPTFSRRFGPEALLRISVCFWPLTYGIYLGMAFVASKGVSVALLPPLLFVAAATDVVACMSFIAQDSLVGKRVPHKRHLAHMNAVGGLAANMGGGLGVAAGNSFFALSLQNNLLGGKAIRVGLIAFSLLHVGLAQRMTVKTGWQEEETKPDAFSD